VNQEDFSLRTQMCVTYDVSE